MTSPARKHFLRHQAAQLAASVPPGESLAGASAYELMLAKLAEDRRKLKDIQSVEGKARLKLQLLPDYVPWVDGVLSAGKGAQDDVLVTVMVWRLDTGDWKGALDIAEYALTHRLVMPDQYQRTMATVIAEELADQALKYMQASGSDPVDLESLVRGELLVREHDMPDQVRAKLEKAIGYALRQAASRQIGKDVATLRSSLEKLKRALQLNHNAGVKKDIEVLERELRTAEKESEQASPQSPTPAQGGTESIAFPKA